MKKICHLFCMVIQEISKAGFEECSTSNSFSVKYSCFVFFFCLIFLVQCRHTNNGAEQLVQGERGLGNRGAYCQHPQRSAGGYAHEEKSRTGTGLSSDAAKLELRGGISKKYDKDA